MKNRKKFLAMILAVLMTFSMPVFANAEETLSFEINGQSRTFSEIAEKANYDEAALYAYYIQEPEEFLRQAEELYRVTPNVRSAGDTSGTDVDSLTELVALGRKGDILISATNSTRVVIDYRHGHAAIVYDEENIVQAIGPGYTSAITTLSQFGATEKVRLYQVEGANDSTAESAANYAGTNLVGKAYNVIAGSDSTSELNCATLVYQAYKNQDISLKKFFGTVRPQSLVEDTKTDAIANINWPGDEDSFDI